MNDVHTLFRSLIGINKRKKMQGEFLSQEFRVHLRFFPLNKHFRQIFCNIIKIGCSIVSVFQNIFCQQQVTHHVVLIQMRKVLQKPLFH